MVMKSLAFAAAAALLASAALAQDNLPANEVDPAADSQMAAPVGDAPTDADLNATTTEAPEPGGVATRSLEDLKSGIEKGEDLPGCRRKNEHIA